MKGIRKNRFNAAHITRRPQAPAKPSQEKTSSVDLGAVKVDHYTERFAQLRDELEKADESGKDLLREQPGQVQTETKKSKCPGVLPEETVSSSKMSTDSDKTSITHQGVNRFGGTSTEQYHLNNNTGVLTVLTGVGDTVNNELQIDTKNGSIMSEKKPNQVEATPSPAIQKMFQWQAEQSGEIHDGAVGYIINS